MIITLIPRRSAARALAWVLVWLLGFAISSRADDEYYGGGGGGGGGGGDIYYLEPYVVNGNDPATFDWGGYFASLAMSGLIGTFANDISLAPTPEPPAEGYSGGDYLSDIGAFSLREKLLQLPNGGVAQQVFWKELPRGANGVIQQVIQITATKDGVTEVVTQRTEAWLVKDGKVYTITNGTQTASTGDVYLMAKYDAGHPDSVKWTGNVVFFPNQELGDKWKSSDSPTDPSKGMLYQDGLLFGLNDPGVHREFVITNNRDEGRWDVTTSTVTTVPNP